MRKSARFIGLAFLISGTLIYMIAYALTLTPAEAAHQGIEGTLTTNDGLKFSYEFYPSDQKGPSVIYIGGMDGKATPERGEDTYVLAPPLNRANFNFIGFGRPGYEASTSLKDKINIARKRGKSGSSIFPANDGQESGAENIVQNEVQTVIEFLEKNLTHDPEKGIYLIGGSFGSWISLVTVASFPDKIKGVVFLSPAILPEMVSAGRQTKLPQFNISNYFQSLIQSFGQRPALAIGSKNAIFYPGRFKDGSAFDSAQFLRRKIGSSVEVMDVSTSQHSKDLVEGNREVKEKIVQWFIDQLGDQ